MGRKKTRKKRKTNLDTVWGEITIQWDCPNESCGIMNYAEHEDIDQIVKCSECNGEFILEDAD